MPVITVRHEDAAAADAQLLIKELTDELSDIYQVDLSSGGFSAEDVSIKGSAFVVARIDGIPSGCGAYKPAVLDDGSSAAELKRIFVKKDKRRLGIAQRILSELEDAARKDGYKTMVLETGDRQPEAVALYIKAGYEQFPPFGRYASQPWSRCYKKSLLVD